MACVSAQITYDSSKPMSTLFVPTAETSSLRFFLDLMVAHKKPVMFVGGAGVGKTQLVKGKAIPAFHPPTHPWPPSNLRLTG